MFLCEFHIVNQTVDPTYYSSQIKHQRIAQLFKEAGFLRRSKVYIWIVQNSHSFIFLEQNIMKLRTISIKIQSSTTNTDWIRIKLQSSEITSYINISVYITIIISLNQYQCHLNKHNNDIYYSKVWYRIDLNVEVYSCAPWELSYMFLFSSYFYTNVGYIYLFPDFGLELFINEA